MDSKSKKKILPTFVTMELVAYLPSPNRSSGVGFKSISYRNSPLVKRDPDFEALSKIS